MTNIVLLVMMAQVQPQMQVSQSELPRIVEAVLQDVIKEDFLPGRGVYLDVQQVTATFRENFVPQASLLISDVGIDLPGRSLLAGLFSQARGMRSSPVLTRWAAPSPAMGCLCQSTVLVAVLVPGLRAERWSSESRSLGSEIRASVSE